MKILFLTNIPSPYRVDFFNELGKFCDLTVLYELKNASDRDKKWESVNAYNFNEVYLRGLRIGSSSALSFSIIKYLKVDLYDFIIIGGYSTPTGMLAISYLNYKKIPFILNSDGGLIKRDNYFIGKLKRYFISSASAWLSTGIITNKYLVHYGAKLSQIYVYPFTSIKNCDVLKKQLTDIEKYELRESLGIIEKHVVITVGQFIPRKGFDVLLKACRLLKDDVGIYIIGGNPPKEYLELVEGLNIKNVHFIEFKGKHDLSTYYRCSDVFVLPTREDIWGLVINEAMANGLPVITTNKCVAGLELVQNMEEGFIVPTEDPMAIANRLNLLLGNDELISKMSANCTTKILSYTIETMVNTHLQIFNHLKVVKK